MSTANTTAGPARLACADDRAESYLPVGSAPAHQQGRPGDMIAQHQMLADIAEALKPGGVLPDEHREFLCDALTDILDGTPADAALGIAVGPGQRSFAYVERHRRRDELLRETARRFPVVGIIAHREAIDRRITNA